jgi:hypothetical protein
MIMRNYLNYWLERESEKNAYLAGCSNSQTRAKSNFVHMQVFCSGEAQIEQHDDEVKNDNTGQHENNEPDKYVDPLILKYGALISSYHRLEFSKKCLRHFKWKAISVDTLVSLFSGDIDNLKKAKAKVDCIDKTVDFNKDTFEQAKACCSPEELKFFYKKIYPKMHSYD